MQKVNTLIFILRKKKQYLRKVYLFFLPLNQVTLKALGLNFPSRIVSSLILSPRTLWEEDIFDITFTCMLGRYVSNMGKLFNNYFNCGKDHHQMHCNDAKNVKFMPTAK